MGKLHAILLFAAPLTLCALPPQARAATPAIPVTHGTALDGHAVDLPQDLAQATVLILGFSRNSANATTAWEKAVRSSLAASYFDMPVLAAAPAFVRPMIVHSIRKQVPDPVWPNFVPLTSNEAEWKQAAAFSMAAPDAAYVILVDRAGTVHWQTHDAPTAETLAQLQSAIRKLNAEPK